MSTLKSKTINIHVKVTAVDLTDDDNCYVVGERAKLGNELGARLLSAAVEHMAHGSYGLATSGVYVDAEILDGNPKP